MVEARNAPLAFGSSTPSSCLGMIRDPGGESNVKDIVLILYDIDFDETLMFFYLNHVAVVRSTNLPRHLLTPSVWL